tara:strand:- start:107 stop:208 length:102 start_codon:yes stop_codon:yes gene_type:complete
LRYGQGDKNYGILKIKMKELKVKNESELNIAKV